MIRSVIEDAIPLRASGDACESVSEIAEKDFLPRIFMPAHAMRDSQYSTKADFQPDSNAGMRAPFFITLRNEKSRSRWRQSCKRDGFVFAHCFRLTMIASRRNIHATL